MILNYRDMKRIIYGVAIAALFVTSCQKTDVLNVAEDTIDFSTQVGKLTKADETYDKLGTLKDQGFRVWTVADFNQGDFKDGEIYRGMDNLIVSYDETNSTNPWMINSDEKYFWPQAKQYLQFYTISSDVLKPKSTDAYWVDDVKFPTHFTKPEGATEITGLDLPEYTVNDVADDDVMVADCVRQTKDDGSGKKTKTVSPLFRHTMTKVEFNFKKGSYTDGSAPMASTVILKEIKTADLSYMGSLDVTYGNGTDPMSFVWTTTDDKTKSFTYTPSGIVYLDPKGSVIPEVETLPEANIKENDYCKIAEVVYVYSKKTEGDGFEWKETTNYKSYNGDVLSEGDHKNYVTWYMIPQDLTEGQTVTITYIADGKVIPQIFKLTVSEDVKLTKDWTEEMCVRYNVTIAPHKVVFNPSVDQWKTDINDNKKEDDEVNMEN